MIAEIILLKNIVFLDFETTSINFCRKYYLLGKGVAYEEFSASLQGFFLSPSEPLLFFALPLSVV